MIGCVLDPGACIDGAVASWLAWFPFGRDGFIFASGMVVGAILGKWGVGAVIALAIAVRSAPGETHEHVSGKDAAPVVKPKKKVRTIFGKR
jgi:hypothetical protein